MLVAAAGQAQKQPSLRSEFPSANLEILGFTLAKTTLADVERRLGPARPGGCSTDADASKMICYVFERPDKTRVIFESGPSGGWSLLDGFKVAGESANLSCNLNCRMTQSLRSSIRTGGGLKLGLTRGEVLSLLGRPTKIKMDQYIYEWSSQISMTKADARNAREGMNEAFWSVNDTIEVTFLGRKVVAFEVHHTVFS